MHSNVIKLPFETALVSALSRAVHSPSRKHGRLHTERAGTADRAFNDVVVADTLLVKNVIAGSALDSGVSRKETHRALKDFFHSDFNYTKLRSNESHE